MIATFDPIPANQMITEYLGAVNEQMGILHDGLVRDSLAGKIDYEKDPVEYPAPLKKALREFAQKLKSP